MPALSFVTTINADIALYRMQRQKTGAVLEAAAPFFMTLLRYSLHKGRQRAHQQALKRGLYWMHGFFYRRIRSAEKRRRAGYGKEIAMDKRIPGSSEPVERSNNPSGAQSTTGSASGTYICKPIDGSQYQEVIEEQEYADRRPSAEEQKPQFSFLKGKDHKDG